MSIALMSKILDGGVPYKTATHKLTMLCIADHASDEGDAYPSLGRLCHKVGISDVRHMRRILRDLEAEGKVSTGIQKAHSPKGKRLETNLFTVMPPAYEGGRVYRPGGSTDPGGAGSTHPGGPGLQTPLIISEPSSETPIVPEPGIIVTDPPNIVPVNLEGMYVIPHGETPQGEKVMGNRQRHAIAASQAKSAKKHLEEMLGDAYLFARTLINEHGYKAETLYNRLASTPLLLERFKELKPERFEELASMAVIKAQTGSDGWEMSTGWQFMELLKANTPDVLTSNDSRSVNQTPAHNPHAIPENYRERSLVSALKGLRATAERSPSDGIFQRINQLKMELFNINPDNEYLKEIHDESISGTEQAAARSDAREAADSEGLESGPPPFDS